MTKVICHYKIIDPTTLQVGEPNPKPLVDTEEHYRKTQVTVYLFFYMIDL